MNVGAHVERPGDLFYICTVLFPDHLFFSSFIYNWGTLIPIHIFVLYCQYILQCQYGAILR